MPDICIFVSNYNKSSKRFFLFVYFVMQPRFVANVHVNFSKRSNSESCIQVMHDMIVRITHEDCLVAMYVVHLLIATLCRDYVHLSNTTKC